MGYIMTGYPADITGLRFGRLTVVGRADSKHWQVLCDCGEKRVTQKSNLTHGANKSCGCLRRERALTMKKTADITGETFGMLTVLRRAERSGPGAAKWLCRCQCGVEKVVIGHHMKTGSTKSCGCLLRGPRPRNSKFEAKPGTTIYRMLSSARDRAEARGVVFDITATDLPPMPEFCPLLGIPLFPGTRIASHNSPSLDRIIPELGYVRGNVQIISKRANSIKNDASLEEFETIYLAWKRQENEKHVQELQELIKVVCLVA